VENRTALLAVGFFPLIEGIILTPFLCGVGILFIIIGAVVWARED
jgi:hypothetical protein